MIEAKIVLDSINPAGSRITTWLLTYPRFIHSEFMTHRIFSRNAASSRAIPSKKLIESVRNNPALFEQVGKANKGMTAEEVLSPLESSVFLKSWKEAGESSADFVEYWSQHIAKQVVNRILEPWMHMTVVATATDHSNFFKLRAHPAAQPEFQVLAYRMLGEYVRSTPLPLEWGQWHLPGLSEEDSTNEDLEDADRLKICTALACRASYSAFDEPLSFADAERIHDRGVQNGHWSPFEHCAQAVGSSGACGAFKRYPWSNFDFPGNGGQSYWGQYRKLFPSECARGFSNEQLTEILNARPSWVRV